MNRLLPILTILASLSAIPGASAGLYNSAEPPLKPDADIGRFLDQLKTLRSYGPPDAFSSSQISGLREEYLRKAEALGRRRLTPQESANLGAYLIRLGRLDEAAGVLDEAGRQTPRSDPAFFAIKANLGTANVLRGDLPRARESLEDAVASAPDDRRKVETYHLALIKGRMRQMSPRGLEPLDDLFGIRFVGDSGGWEVGKLAASEAKKLPDGSIQSAAEIVKELLLCHPEDARLHWLLGELANAQGDIRAAHKAMDIAVFNLRLSTPELKERRRLLEEAKASLPSMLPVVSLDEEKPAPPPSDLLANFGWKAWLVIGLGGGLILLLLGLQIKQILGRRLHAK
jgi:tetratricopeptide (TPR) repeat protein